MPPAAHISGIAGAFIHSKALYSAAKLGVADVLGERAMPVSKACLNCIVLLVAQQ